MKRLVRVLALIGTLLVGAAALSLIVSQTAWFKDWLRGYIVRQANQYLEGRLTIGRLDGNLFFGVEMVDVAVTLDGERVIAVKDIGLDYSVLDFMSRGIVLDDIRLNQPLVRLERDGDGWNVGRLVKEQRREADREGPGLPVTIGEVGISNGTVTIAGMPEDGAVESPRRIERIDASVGFLYEPVRYTVDIGQLSFRTVDPAFQLDELSGRIAVVDDALHVEKLAIRSRASSIVLDGVVRDYLTQPTIQATVSSDKLALTEIARLLPGLRGYELQPAFELRASGPLDALRVELHARSEAGDVDANVVADLSQSEGTIEGDVEVRRLNLAPLLRDPAQRSDITARAAIDLRLLQDPAPGPLGAVAGTWRVDAPQVAIMGYAARDVVASGRFDRGVVHVDGRAAAYGGRATARGTITPGDTLALDLRGDARRIDLRNLPRAWGVPGTPGDLNVTYHVTGRPGGGRARDLRASVVFRPSRLAGASIAEGGTARVRLVGPRLEYAADLDVQALDVQQIGAGFGIDALADDRYRTRLNGRISAEGSGTTLATMALSSRGTLHDSIAFGGRWPELSFDASLRESDLRVRAQGRFADLDPAVISGRPEVTGRVQGIFDVDATIRDLGAPLAPESLSARGRMALTDSRIADLPIESIALAGAYDRGAGDIELLEIAGPDLKVQASGPLDLRAGGGRSNVEYQADLSRLEALAAIADLPLTGTAQLKGVLSGNGDELVVAGDLEASNVRYGEHSVLSASSRYRVRLPDLSPSQAEVTIEGQATMLELAGQELTGLELEATWQQPVVRFKTTATEGERNVTAEGRVVLHPDHQEVHLSSLALRSAGTAWRTATGTEAAVRYGGGRLEIDNLHLVSGDQHILAAGSVGDPDARLHLDVRNVDLAVVDQIALGEQRFGGVLTVNATVTGTLDSPSVDAVFAVRNGSFREYRYDSFSGTARYTPAGVRFDAQLTQSPVAWITAKGFVPSTMFRPAVAGSPPGAPLDVLVTSSELDLAVVQGFVPQLSRVSGTLKAEVRVTGSTTDPHLQGFVEVRNGAFTVAELTKGGYTGLDTRMTLEPDRVVIDRFRILDEHRNWLEVAGELAVHRRQVGDVEIGITARQFEIIDNQLADIKVDTDLRITGSLPQPQITGRLGVHTGQVRLDRIFEDLTTDAYSLTPTEIEASPQAAVTPAEGATAQVEAGRSPRPAQEEPQPTGSFFEALALDVELSVPNNLVIRGRNLNPAGAAPIGLGDLNVTVGGDMRARKERGEPTVSLVGTVNTVRGTYDFQGRRFDIQRDGRIQFTGGWPIDPRLDITATRIIAGVEALVHVRGTARAPELSLSSRPPQDEADILSLIVFNQPVNALGEGQQVSLAERAGALATGFVASSLAQSISGALELDIFEIQTTAEAGGGGTLTVGEQVGERLFVRFRQGFGAQAMSEFILEYQLADYLRLQTSLAEGNSATRRTLTRRVEQAGVDLIFFFSY